MIQVMLLVQTDVTARVNNEIRMTLMNETQLGMLEQVSWIYLVLLGRSVQIS